MTQKKAEPTEFNFAPSRLLGILILVPLSVLLLALNVLAFLFFSRQEPGLAFFLSFILSVAFLIPVAFFFYRSYALIASSYTLARSALQIKWGLRQETIPLSEIDWIRTPAEMAQDIPWPFLPMPGAYVGKVTTENQDQIEFMASDTANMLFVGTSHAIYGISPAKPQQFLAAFERVLQLGTLSEASWETVEPADWLASSWSDKVARYSFIFSVALLSILSLWIGFRFSGTSTIALGYSAEGRASETIPVRNVLILPLMAAGFWILNLLLGIQIYRRQQLKLAAEILWSGSSVVMLLFLIAGFFII